MDVTVDQVSELLTEIGTTIHTLRELIKSLEDVPKVIDNLPMLLLLTISIGILLYRFIMESTERLGVDRLLVPGVLIIILSISTISIENNPRISISVIDMLDQNIEYFITISLYIEMSNTPFIWITGTPVIEDRLSDFVDLNIDDDDLSDQRSINSDTLKSLTSGESITARELFMYTPKHEVKQIMGRVLRTQSHRFQDDFERMIHVEELPLTQDTPGKLADDIDEFLHDSIWNRRKDEYQNRLDNIVSRTQSLLEILKPLMEEYEDVPLEKVSEPDEYIEYRDFTCRNRNKNLEHVLDGYRTTYSKVEVFNMSYTGNNRRYDMECYIRNNYQESIPDRCIAIKELDNMDSVCVALWK